MKHFAVLSTIPRCLRQTQGWLVLLLGLGSALAASATEPVRLLLKQKPQLVKAFREASLKGWEYAMQHPEELVQLIYARYSQRHSLEHLRFEARQMVPLLQMSLVEPGHMHPGRWRHIAETYAELGMLKPDFPLSGFLYDPNPPAPNLRWVYGLMAGAALVIAVASAFGIWIYRINVRLHREASERKLAGEALRASEERYRSILNSIPDAILITDLEGSILMASPGALRMSGAAREEELLGHPHADFILPEDRERAGSNVGLMLQGIYTGPAEYRGLRVDGSAYDLEANAEVIRDAEGQPMQLLFMVRDTTERKQSQDLISNLLAEKELILKEVHHRIKNNMTTIYSLLSLQAGVLNDPEAIEALQDCGRRVLSMMVLYDKLYQSIGFNSMSVVDYFPLLVDEIIANFPHRASVRIDKQIEDFVLDVKRLQPLGIIINELLTNIMKHAFAEGTAGAIAVSMRLREEQIVLVIQDNGIGIPEVVDSASSAGFGLMLVDILTRQLKGTLRMERQHGTRTTLEFAL